MPGTPERWKRAAAGVGGAAGRVPRRDEPDALDALETRGARDPRRPRADRPAALHPRARGDRDALARARGDAGTARGDARTGRAADHRGRVRAARARRRGGASDLQALLGKHGFLPGVAGHASAGQPALPADARTSASTPTSSATRRSCTTLVDADRRQVRRLAEGRARHRRQHGAVTSSASGGRRRPS